MLMKHAISLQGVKKEKREVCTLCNKCRKSTDREAGRVGCRMNRPADNGTPLLSTRSNGKVRNGSFEYLKHIPLPAFMYPGEGLCLERSTPAV